MKKTFLKLGTSALLVGGLTLTACDSTTRTDAADDTEVVVEDMDEDFEAQRVEYVNRLETQEERLEERMANLRTEMDQAGDEAKGEYEQAIDRLQRSKDNLDKQIDRAQAATKNEWNEFKGEVDKAMTDIDQEFEELDRKFEVEG